MQNIKAELDQEKHEKSLMKNEMTRLNDEVLSIRSELRNAHKKIHDLEHEVKDCHTVPNTDMSIGKPRTDKSDRAVTCKCS